MLGFSVFDLRGGAVAGCIRVFLAFGGKTVLFVTHFVTGMYQRSTITEELLRFGEQQQLWTA